MTHPKKTHLFLFCAAAAAMLALAVSCCRRQPPAKAPSSTSAARPAKTEIAAQQPELVENYRLIRSLEVAVESPRGIALNERERLIYIACASGIALIDYEGILQKMLPTPAAATCVAVEDDGNVFAGAADRVICFDNEGHQVAAWGDTGSKRAQFRMITGITAKGGNVFLADAVNQCILYFESGGRFVNEIGRREPSAPGAGIVCPSPFLDCAVDSEGIVWVVNPGRLRVERYRPDGTLIGFWGEGGMREDQFFGCCNPTNIAVGPEGRIAVSEKKTIRAKVFDSTGRLLAIIRAQHFSKKAEGMDLAFDSAGRLFVLDNGDSRIKVFEKAPPEKKMEYPDAKEVLPQ